MSKQGAVVAKAVVNVIPSMKGARGAIRGGILPHAKDTGKEAGEIAGAELGKSTSSVAGKVLAGAAAVAAIGGAVAGTVKSAIEKYANYEQLAGGVETLFKDSADVVKGYADNAYLSAGLSANNYMETVTSFSASLLQGLNGDTAKAAKVADQAITDMSDNANKMGTDISMIQNAYQGFAKQNYTMLDNLKLGYGGTASEMARLINDSGVLGDTVEVTAKTVNDVSFDKMIEAIHKVQDNMDITGTTAKEASETIEGSINSMKAAWDNWLTALGREDADIADMTKRLVDSVITVAKNVVPRAGEILKSLKDALIEGLPSIVSDLASGLAGLFGVDLEKSMSDSGANSLIKSFKTAFDGNIPGVLDELKGSFSDAFTSITDAFSNTGLTEKFGELSSGIMDLAKKAIPYIVAGISAFIRGISLLVTEASKYISVYIETVGSFISDIIDIAGPIVENIFGNLQDAFGGIVQIFDGVKTALQPIIDRLFPAFQGFMEGIKPVLEAMFTVGMKLWEVVTKIFAVIMQFLGPIIQLLGNALAPLIDGICEVIGFLWPIVCDLFTGVFDFLGMLLDGISGAIDFIAGIPGAIVDFFSDFPNNMLKIWATVYLWGIQKFAELRSFVSKIPGAVVDFFKSLPDRLSGFFTSAKDKVVEIFWDIVDFVSTIPGKIIDFFTSIPDKISEVFRNIHIPTFHVDGEFNLDPTNFQIPHISFYADGGIVTKPHLGMVGEGGEPEAIIPLSRLGDYVGGLERGGGNVYHMYIDGAEVNDNEEMKKVFIDSMLEFARKAGMNRG